MNVVQMKPSLTTYYLLFTFDSTIAQVSASFYEVDQHGSYQFYKESREEVMRGQYQKKTITPVFSAASSAGVVVFEGSLPEFTKVKISRPKPKPKRTTQTPRQTKASPSKKKG